jgi:hypothetical protein
MRLTIVALSCLLVAACKQDRTADSSSLRPGDAGWTSSSGEVALTDGETLSFTITSERYKAWDAARQGIDRRIAARFGALLQAASPSRRSIEKAAAYLESEPAAKAAIERAGMSIRDFVVTTVALEQEMKLASARGQIPRDSVGSPYPTNQPYPVDTTSFSTYTPIPLPEPVPVVRQYIDTFPRPDSQTRRDSFVITRMDTSRRSFPIADSIARAAARRDSAARATRPRDTMPNRDTTSKSRDTTRIPRDTVRDTMPAYSLAGWRRG